MHIREKLALFAIYEIVKATFVHLLHRDNRGAYRIFQKGRLRPAVRNAGGVSASGPIRKAGGGVGGGGGGAIRFRPDTKSGGGLLSRRGGRYLI